MAMKDRHYSMLKIACPSVLILLMTPQQIEKTPSAVDYPYLDQDPRTDQKLSLEEVGKLADLVDKWKIADIVNTLRNLKILYERGDNKAERLPLNEINYDEGEHRVKVEKGKSHLINGRLNHLNTTTNPKRHVSALRTTRRMQHTFAKDPRFYSISRKAQRTFLSTGTRLCR